MGQLPRQSNHGRCAVEPRTSLLSHRSHKRPIAARPARLRKRPWIQNTERICTAKSKEELWERRELRQGVDQMFHRSLADHRKGRLKGRLTTRRENMDDLRKMVK